jgi:hypothetical protein
MKQSLLGTFATYFQDPGGDEDVVGFAGASNSMSWATEKRSRIYLGRMISAITIWYVSKVSIIWQEAEQHSMIIDDCHRILSRIYRQKSYKPNIGFLFFKESIYLWTSLGVLFKQYIQWPSNSKGFSLLCRSIRYPKLWSLTSINAVKNG